MMRFDVQEKLKPQNLINISNDQIDDHWNLYKGYVNQTNQLNQELADLAKDGKRAALVYADRRRRYGFEYNGMVLHEYYFGNLISGAHDLENGDLKKQIEATWGSYQAWKEDFEAAGKTRGIGWALLYADTTTGLLTNHFIPEHSDGHVAGAAPILVMDVWEHAYMVDHKASGRGDYIAAFMQNINWDKVQTRYDLSLGGKIAPRF